MSRIKSNKVLIGESYFIYQSENIKKEEPLDVNIDEIINSAKNQAKIEANKIIEEAKNGAKEIIEKAKISAKEKFDEILNEAKIKGEKEGFESGYNQGQIKIETELEDKIINVNNFAKCTYNIKKQIIKSAYADIMDLVILIASKVCNKAFEFDNSILENIIHLGISKLSENNNIKIIINPDMFEKISIICENIKKREEKLDNIQIIQDVNLSKNKVLVESINCRVDCSIESQIEEIANKLFEKVQMQKFETNINEDNIENL